MQLIHLCSKYLVIQHTLQAISMALTPHGLKIQTVLCSMNEAILILLPKYTAVSTENDHHSFLISIMVRDIQIAI